MGSGLVIGLAASGADACGNVDLPLWAFFVAVIATIAVVAAGVWLLNRVL